LTLCARTGDRTQRPGGRDNKNQVEQDMDGISSFEEDRIRTLFIGNFLPRKCGIATFTSDLYRAVAGQPDADPLGVVAMNNTEDGYDYPDTVTFQIQQQSLDDYQRAARFINSSDADLVCLQHEFGIFGGDAGSHLGTLLADLEIPVVTTLHTVLEQPQPPYRRSMLDVIRWSDRLVVMSERAMRILREVYDVPDSQMALIHHGTPDMPLSNPDAHKEQLGLAGRPVILTFGLLSPNKGIEHALEALPPVVERFPQLAYVVLGATHPEVRRHSGEGYRMYLEQKVRDLHLEDNVIFHDRFVEFDELLQFLSAADIYLTPYLCREQIVSGTLAYAVAMGRAVISTPYWYAEELLADGRGVIVEFGDAYGLTSAIGRLLGDKALRTQLRERAHAFGRQMIWSEVGHRYVAQFARVLEERRETRLAWTARDILFSPPELPEVKLDHLLALTDENGVVQHAHGPVPDLRHGYSADDVGRALVVLSRAQSHQNGELADVMSGYLAYLERAQLEDGRFHNFMDASGRFLDKEGSEDTFGRVIWGLGTVLHLANDETLRRRAAHLFEKAAPHLRSLTHVRAKAYAICGLAGILKRFENAHVLRHTLEEMATSLVELYGVNREEQWHWFEDVVTYGNAIPCQALLWACSLTGDEAMCRCGLESLDFLISSQWNRNYFDFVGNEGWWVKDGARAIFGQQPIEAAYLTAACVAAYETTADEHYLVSAQHCFEWFFGRNRLNALLYDSATGAVHDGLDPHGVSRNTGAESVIAFLLALLSLARLTPEKSKKVSA
jgi:glycosyltransferase involved in cell wall biosynthesis